MTDYSVLEFCYNPSTIKRAIKIAQGKAKLYPEGYYNYTDGDFEPHIWVVAAVCAGICECGEEDE